MFEAKPMILRRSRFVDQRVEDERGQLPRARCGERGEGIVDHVARRLLVILGLIVLRMVHDASLSVFLSIRPLARQIRMYQTFRTKGLPRRWLG
jgi:hypothetical protein